MRWSEGRVETVEDLASGYGPVHPLAALKQIDRLDDHCRSYIADCPFVALGTTNGDGTGDVSPKGGLPGFVKVLDDHHLAFGDRSGNNRLDSLRNLVARPEVGLLFLIPGFSEAMLRVNGEGVVTRNTAVLDTCTFDGERGATAVVVTVREAFIHCSKALYRAGLWDPAKWPDTSGLAGISAMVRDHVALSTGQSVTQADNKEVSSC